MCNLPIQANLCLNSTVNQKGRSSCCIIKSYPIQWIKRNDVQKRSGLKTLNKPDLIISGISNIQSHSFINDAARVWNEASRQIKDSMTLSSAKNI